MSASTVLTLSVLCAIFGTTSIIHTIYQIYHCRVRPKMSKNTDSKYVSFRSTVTTDIPAVYDPWGIQPPKDAVPTTPDTETISYLSINSKTPVSRFDRSRVYHIRSGMDNFEVEV